jgi:glycosyltransferase involved in cell wall biosynthesis
MTRILVLTRSYPAAGDLYKYPFVHRRVVAFSAAGHDVRVFRPGENGQPMSHEFDSVTCWTGNPAALQAFVEDWRPDVVAAHGFSEGLWDLLEPLSPSIPIRAWLHGSEIPDFMRQKALVAPASERAKALEQLKARCAFWNRLLGDFPSRLKLVFVSKTSIELARTDWGGKLTPDLYSVVPNPIDTDLFAYRAKSAEDRFNVLLIRPFDSQTYANDLAVDAILKLAGRPDAEKLRFTIIGDGPLFDETVGPLAGLPNVSVSRRFLTQEEIADEHGRHGLFLVPTRLDTQGVSRDEAMASGLVPVTNAIPAVLEFADESCAALAPPGDSDALAQAMLEMVRKPGLFLERSKAAAERIRSERSSAVIIPRELGLLEEAAHG